MLTKNVHCTKFRSNERFLIILNQSFTLKEKHYYESKTTYYFMMTFVPLTMYKPRVGFATR